MLDREHVVAAASNDRRGVGALGLHRIAGDDHPSVVHLADQRDERGDLVGLAVHLAAGQGDAVLGGQPEAVAGLVLLGAAAALGLAVHAGGDHLAVHPPAQHLARADRGDRVLHRLGIDGGAAGPGRSCSRGPHTGPSRCARPPGTPARADAGQRARTAEIWSVRVVIAAPTDHVGGLSRSPAQSCAMRAAMPTGCVHSRAGREAGSRIRGRPARAGLRCEHDSAHPRHQTHRWQG
jgi:hypothetical protein